jgi:putative spermidine/putrescine transport system permease protein
MRAATSGPKMMNACGRWPAIVLRSLLLLLFAVVIFGPLLNLLLWTVAEAWYFPAKLPIHWGFSYWGRVFRPEAGAMLALGNSLWIAVLTVLVSTALAIPAGYALSRRSLPWRSMFLLVFLLPQAFPAIAVDLNIARIFYGLGLNGTVTGVVLVHTLQGLVFSVWIASAAFAGVHAEQVEAARNLGASPWRAFFTVSLPQASPGIIASAIFVFLISLDEFSGTFFVGAPDISTLPLQLYTAATEGNYQIASITALLLLLPSILFMLVVERFLRADVLAKIGT